MFKEWHFCRHLDANFLVGPTTSAYLSPEAFKKLVTLSEAQDPECAPHEGFRFNVTDTSFGNCQDASFRLYGARAKLHFQIIKDRIDANGSQSLLIASAGSGNSIDWARNLSPKTTCVLVNPCNNTMDCWWLEPKVSSDCEAFRHLSIEDTPSKNLPSLLRASMVFGTNMQHAGSYSFTLHVPLYTGRTQVHEPVKVTVKVVARVCAKKSPVLLFGSTSSESRVYTHTESLRVNVTNAKDIDGLLIPADTADSRAVVVTITTPSRSINSSMVFNSDKNMHFAELPGLAEPGMYTLSLVQDSAELSQQCLWEYPFEIKCAAGYYNNTGNCARPHCGEFVASQTGSIGSAKSELTFHVNGATSAPEIVSSQPSQSTIIPVVSQGMHSRKWSGSRRLQIGAWQVQYRVGDQMCNTTNLTHVSCKKGYRPTEEGDCLYEERRNETLCDLAEATSVTPGARKRVPLQSGAEILKGSDLEVTVKNNTNPALWQGALIRLVAKSIETPMQDFMTSVALDEVAHYSVLQIVDGTSVCELLKNVNVAKKCDTEKVMTNEGSCVIPKVKADIKSDVLELQERFKP